MNVKSHSPTPPAVGFISLGCPKNLVDSEVMMGMLRSAGATLTPDAAAADILVVNTCSFIDSARQESVNAILDVIRHKQSHGGRAQRLIVAGCLVERYRDEIQKSIPEVDALVGTGELDAILLAAGLNPAKPAPSNSPFAILPQSDGKQLAHRASSAVKKVSRPQISTKIASRPEGDHRRAQGRFSRAEWTGAHAELPTYLYDDATPRILSTPRASAYIKIAEGCDHPCSFCIIPQLRGQFRSRRLASVVAEAESLVAQGVREITLIGQDTTCYGEDLGLKDGLATLLDSLARIPNLRWLRFLYAYPNKITTRLLEVMAAHPNICRYLDVPLQHASPSVLKSMKRGGSGEIFLRTIEKARRIVPGIVLRTSFIVGFPGESAADFDLLCDFVRRAQLDWLGVFAYSDEEGSPAHALPGKLPARTIESRRRRLMELQRSISRRNLHKWVGRTLDVLVEGESTETELLWEGRTQLHAPEIDGKLFLNDLGPLDSLAPGAFHRAQITESHDYDLVARILD